MSSSVSDGSERTAPGDKQAMVDDVFSSVAPRYDLMNDLMSGGLHRLWKGALVTALNPPRTGAPFRVLDVAGGTGDIAFRIAERSRGHAQVTVADINPAMLDIGRQRTAKRDLGAIDFREANAEALPFEDAGFDAYTIAFGIRNVPRVETALEEAMRVLKRGGRFLCLEFSEVDTPMLDRLYDLYSSRVIPRLGRAVAGDAEAYRYLVDSIRAFPNQERFADMVRAAGFGRVGVRNFAGGIAALTCGWKLSEPAMRDLFRLMRAGAVLARAGTFGFARLDDLPPPAQGAFRLARMLEPRGLTPTERGRRMSDALTRLGPSYIKLGQFLATRQDIVGAEMADALSTLKDDLPPFPTEEARRIVEESIGAPVESVFESFSDPVAAASIAQVHKAVLMHPEGPETVAVKVLRPGVRARFQRDLGTFYAGARFLEKNAPEARRLRPIAVVEILQRSVSLEMDLRLEAAAYSEMSENIADETDFRLPKVNWELTGRDVLVTEWVQGTRLRDRDAIVAAGHDPQRIAASVVQTFLRHALRDGFFHADMHEGNLFVDDSGELVAVDLGIMGRIGPKEQRFLAEILYGFIRRDYQRIAEVHIEAGYVPRIHSAEDFAQALRAIGEPIHGHRASEISMAKLLGLLFEVTDIFDMQTRPELVLLQKTMVVVEGVARRLDPDFDMWITAEPVVREWVEKNLGISGRLEEAASNARQMLQFVQHLPETLARVDSAVDRLAAFSAGGLKLDEETVDRLARASAGELYWSRWAIRIGAAALVILAAIAVL